ALQRARERLASAELDGQRWYWPADENPASKRHQVPDRVRLLAPFDPVVWDRLRFERFWGWAYRFEAYTPAPKRLRGHYALPLLWRDAVIGWANLKVQNGQLQPDLGYVDGRPTEPAFTAALDDELADFSRFLGLAG
ncbi:DNA glycosylase AlkZ-like family protein, partial [Ideonella sp.]|uniref:DNA glycosylase AlkZ-like family protein n=1 Tax=Ideonella sp. TaxID=1929293 RepID=UPI003BB69514